ncbi:hypothetical protein ACE7GA_23765 [Roseomonas sp. CCTCC AB2023176]|uniref:hypothetical protein n=1 Tax=Roseomonas sp. CCTCC AB2023176 TaxID=3342640 RepID=UPI0035D696C7
MIYLLHIPKTAGQTLAARVGGAFAAERVRIHIPIVGTREEVAALAAAHDFVGAHTGFGILREPPPGVEFMASVRDPIRHVVSHVRHIRRDPLNALHAASVALPIEAFLERFADYFLTFQTRGLVRPFFGAEAADLVHGEDAWLLRHLPAAAERIRWLVPTESVDEFCILWSLESGRRLAETAEALNAAPPDDVDAAAIREWLLRDPGRFALDSILWTTARRRYAAWRHGLATAADDPALIAPALRAAADGDAGVWLVRDWHPAELQVDGSVVWWAGPGQASRVRLRRGAHRRLVFDGLSFSGVYWDRVEVLRESTLATLVTRRSLDAGSGTVRFEVAIGDLASDETLLVFAEEDVTRVPAASRALGTPRRSFATRNWRLD